MRRLIYALLPKMLLAVLLSKLTLTADEAQSQPFWFNAEL
jgi:hypothetical protein